MHRRTASRSSRRARRDDRGSFDANAVGAGLPRSANRVRRGRAASGRASRRRCSGIGGGLVKVPVMHVVMGVPLRVATATSNLMMGITASAERDHLPVPRRHRPVRRVTDGARRLPRGQPRLAGRPPDRPPDPARPVRRDPALHCVADAPASPRLTAGPAPRSAGRPRSLDRSAADGRNVRLGRCCSRSGSS